jgi:hypothetical protein
MTEDEARREARLGRLLLATNDMADVAAALRLLRDKPWSLMPRERRVLYAGVFASYARAFNTSRGDPPLPAASTSGLSREQRQTHEWALAERDKVWAHIDREQVRRAVGVETGAENILALVETFEPPTPEELAALLELVDSLHERYRAEAESLWQEGRS